MSASNNTTGTRAATRLSAACTFRHARASAFLPSLALPCLSTKSWSKKQSTPRRVVQAACVFWQGLTFVNFSAQRKRFLWDRGCVYALFRDCSSGVREYQGLFEGVFLCQKRLRLS